MGELFFEVDDDLRKVVDHAMKAEEWKGPYGADVPSEPTLWLVHDQGVYLMSAGQPGLSKAGEGALVAYANGCDPQGSNKDWYDNARSLVGGDDFVDAIGATVIAEIIQKGVTQVILRVTPEKISILEEVTSDA